MLAPILGDDDEDRLVAVDGPRGMVASRSACSNQRKGQPMEVGLDVWLPRLDHCTTRWSKLIGLAARMRGMHAGRGMHLKHCSFLPSCRHVSMACAQTTALRTHHETALHTRGLSRVRDSRQLLLGLTVCWSNKQPVRVWIITCRGTVGAEGTEAAARIVAA